ncbi:SIR2 family protein [Dethiobacter alkaliphilus]|uniref:SIR2 family protein n=1 Tax=Dethiobacter alkaliphilus TaxID=427926 RepID=UPI0022273A32|nr:SIR2 family protein [Dethiobacter alkaliphilus]MCW3491540.1 SIR2 family protein [Dethiobacter alkaliphilus]
MSESTIFEYKKKIKELLSQTRVSLLIGAGCSVCAGLPLMKQLTEMVYHKIEGYENLQCLDQEAINLISDIKRIYEGIEKANIEDVLSELQDIDAILNRQISKGIEAPVHYIHTNRYNRQHVQIALNYIKNEISNILSQQTSTIRYHKVFCKALHYNLAHGRDRGKHPINYFILNYDTLFEDALALEGIYFDDGFVGGATAWWNPKQLISNQIDYGLEARLYKLHGSIDWVRPEGTNFPMRIRKTIPVLETLVNGEPVVIYPASTKYIETQNNPYSLMLQKFKEALSQTDNHVLTILGYAFNDEHINATIYEGLRESQGKLTLLILLGEKDLPSCLSSWQIDDNVNHQILICGKNGIWKDGTQVCNSEEDLEWYKFEVICEIIAGGEV